MLTYYHNSKSLFHTYYISFMWFSSIWGFFKLNLPRRDWQPDTPWGTANCPEQLRLEELPLGVTIPQKLVSTIKAGGYVQLYAVFNPREEYQTNTVNTRGKKASVSINHSFNSRTSNIEQWTNAMHIYEAIYIPAHPSSSILISWDK